MSVLKLTWFMSTGGEIIFFVKEGLQHNFVPFLYLEKVTIDLTPQRKGEVDPKWSRFCFHTESAIRQISMPSYLTHFVIVTRLDV